MCDGDCRLRGCVQLVAINLTSPTSLTQIWALRLELKGAASAVDGRLGRVGGRTSVEVPGAPRHEHCVPPISC